MWDVGALTSTGCRDQVTASQIEVIETTGNCASAATEWNLSDNRVEVEDGAYESRAELSEGGGIQGAYKIFSPDADTAAIRQISFKCRKTADSVVSESLRIIGRKLLECFRPCSAGREESSEGLVKSICNSVFMVFDDLDLIANQDSISSVPATLTAATLTTKNNLPAASVKVGLCNLTAKSKNTPANPTATTATTAAANFRVQSTLLLDKVSDSHKATYITLCVKILHQCALECSRLTTGLTAGLVASKKLKSQAQIQKKMREKMVIKNQFGHDDSERFKTKTKSKLDQGAATQRNSGDLWEDGTETQNTRRAGLAIDKKRLSTDFVYRAGEMSSFECVQDSCDEDDDSNSDSSSNSNSDFDSDRNTHIDRDTYRNTDEDAFEDAIESDEVGGISVVNNESDLVHVRVGLGLGAKTNKISRELNCLNSDSLSVAWTEASVMNSHSDFQFLQSLFFSGTSGGCISADALRLYKAYHWSQVFVSTQSQSLVPSTPVSMSTSDNALGKRHRCRDVLNGNKEAVSVVGLEGPGETLQNSGEGSSSASRGMVFKAIRSFQLKLGRFEVLLCNLLKCVKSFIKENLIFFDKNQFVLRSLLVEGSRFLRLLRPSMPAESTSRMSSSHRIHSEKVEHLRREDHQGDHLDISIDVLDVRNGGLGCDSIGLSEDLVFDDDFDSYCDTNREAESSISIVSAAAAKAATMSKSSRSFGNRKKRIRSRNRVIDQWLGAEGGEDCYADLEDFIVE